MNTHKIILGTIIALFVFAGTAFAKDAKKAVVFPVEITVVDEQGLPVSDARMITSEGAFSWYSDANGKISADVVNHQVNTVSKDGYEDVIFACSQNNIPDKIVMRLAAVLPEGEGSPAAVGSIGGEELEAFPELVFTNSLQGRIAGLVVSLGANGLGNNTPTMYVRGLHGNSANTPIILIDGLERTAADIVPEEVEKVEVYKDALGKIMYGPRGANGVVSITSKRGKANQRISHVTTETGINIGTRIPKFLNSYDYATLYNEARMNDGLQPVYSADQIEGYRNSKGENDLLYPDVDYYDYFTRNTSSYRKIGYNLAGGTEKLKYALVANYLYGSGFEKVGDLPELNRFNIRGNIDAEVTDYLSIVGDMAARLETRAWGDLNMGSVYTKLSTTRPNEYPLMIASDVIGLTPDESGVPFFGANMISADNLLAHMQYGGFNSERYITSQANIGLKFDFNRFVEGLKANIMLMYDNYSHIGQGQADVYPIYVIRGTSTEALEFQALQKTSLQANQSLNSESLTKTLGYNGNVSYERTFGKHYAKADLSYNYFNDDVSGVGQDVINDNTALKLDYGFDRKFFFEGVVSLMGSNRFDYGNRNFLSFAAGASWFITDGLKLKASYGHLGYDRNTSAILYNTRWINGSTSVNFGEQNNGNSFHTTDYQRAGRSLKWETDDEWNVGIEGSFLSNRLNAEVNVFQEYRTNIVTANSSQRGSLVGDFSGSANLGAVNNGGIDAAVTWAERRGDFSYEIGANLLYSRNKLVSWNEVDYDIESMKSVGKPTDAIFGYKAVGLFGKDIDIASAPVQELGKYRIGDIAYEDTSADGIIDERDSHMIGNSFPRAHIGLDIDLRYKGWGFFAQGAAQLGVYTLCNNSYFQMAGQDKYSVKALDRYHPSNNPDGKYPALTSTSSTNNFLKSTFWLENTSFFRLKNVELSYTFQFKQSPFKALKLFTRGTNLFLISGEKDLDPETMNAGVTTYPLYRTITGGLTITL